DRGVLILSELAGAASELSEALLVNPMDPDDVSQALLQAVNMPDDVQREKLEFQQTRIREYSVNHWINDFLKQLSETKTYQQLQGAKHVSNQVEATILTRFAQAKKRLLLLDYDGTLVPFSKHPKLAVPDENLIKMLTQLAHDPDTDVAVISGRDRDSLNGWFGTLPMHIVSEHGAEIRLKNEDWKYAVDLDHSWKAIFRPVLEVYTQRSPGSFIEDKKHTLVWHYRNVETGLGFTRSRELLDNLHHLIRNTGLNIIDGNRVIEIRKTGIDKGSVARQLTEQLPYDFVLAMGDDKTDEDMFVQLQDEAFTVKIGPGQTAAQYYITRQADVMRLLEKMVLALPEKLYHKIEEHAENGSTY
ncbi:MAG TPA: trehalose-phosphatase, partial [Cyclobacteriaceae bacterium]|nr:trehalose-phosphatase [Cyclobacteriaceae bacterium]